MAPSQNQALPTFRELVWFIRNIMTVHKKGGGRGNDETIVLIKISEIKIKATHSHVWKKVALCCHLVKFPTVNMGKKKENILFLQPMRREIEQLHCWCVLTQCLKHDEVWNSNSQSSIKRAKVMDIPTVLILKWLKHHNSFYRSHCLKSTKSKHNICFE